MGMPTFDTDSLTLEHVMGNIIESIAMEETALSHILNAESEKIMAVIEHSDVTPEQLLAVNLSVKNIINEIIRLETILQAKLDLLKPIICKNKIVACNNCNIIDLF